MAFMPAGEVLRAPGFAPKPVFTGLAEHCLKVRLAAVKCCAPDGVQEDCNVVSGSCMAGQVLLSVLNAASKRLGMMSCTCGVQSIDSGGWCTCMAGDRVQVYDTAQSRSQSVA